MTPSIIQGPQGPLATFRTNNGEGRVQSWRRMGHADAQCVPPARQSDQPFLGLRDAVRAARAWSGIPELAAEVYIASAENDDSYPPAMAVRFEDALTKAGLRHSAESYPGASHGWMVPDFPVYDHDSADRGWKAMLALFERTLRR